MSNALTEFAATGSQRVPECLQADAVARELHHAEDTQRAQHLQALLQLAHLQMRVGPEPYI